MAIKVRILGDGEKQVEYREGVRVVDVLRELGLLENEYVVVRRGKVVAEDTVLEDGDELVLYPVVSGG
ncbi:MoaD/ThiS family protein [Pyrofollis japonicus]|uniref:MoaD/ThiS family protein n=1 Tax=Pyrofollis japonicus TaxID=3060460 RepID=UPI00295ACD20|nr:MoaD/ThiS family protein [Pyrofollis japonicus]BEP18432.1 MoaD/ThiS family protein [Pyrofollis japonicus]